MIEKSTDKPLYKNEKNEITLEANFSFKVNQNLLKEWKENYKEVYLIILFDLDEDISSKNQEENEDENEEPNLELGWSVVSLFNTNGAI
jgi:heme oxygenase